MTVADLAASLKNSYHFTALAARDELPPGYEIRRIMLFDIHGDHICTVCTDMEAYLCNDRGETINAL
jgi:hypothetical protein